MQRKHLATTLLACLLAGPALAAERREHDAHVHGIAELEIASLGNSMHIELRSPAMNLVGFEHAPASEADRAAVAAALARLREGADLFAPFGTDCRLAEAAAEWHQPGIAGDGTEAGADHGHDDHGEADEHAHGDESAHAGEHAEIHARYRFDCDAAAAGLEVHLLRAFEATERLRARYLTTERQGAAVLRRGSARLRFE